MGFPRDLPWVRRATQGNWLHSLLPSQAMGRIFVGLCQVGAWGCFDEFNRLEERMLSAVSQQVQCIQEALREHSSPSLDKGKASLCPRGL